MLFAIEIGRSILWYIDFPYELKGWAEGYMVDQSMLLSNGHSIYVDPSIGPVTPAVYGFLYPLLLSPFVHFLGPSLAAARGLSAVASVFSVLCVFRAGRRRSGSFLGGMTCVILAMGSYYLGGECWDWAHPDALYVAFGLGALWCVDVEEGRLAGWRLVLAILLSGASWCSKQTGVGFMVAIATSLFLRDRRLAARYVIGSVIFVLAVLTVGDVLTQGQFDKWMLVLSKDAMEWQKLLYLLAYLAMYAPLISACAIWQMKRDLQARRGADPLLWACVWMGLACTAAFVKSGGWWNNTMPFLLLFSVPAGTRLWQIMADTRKGTRGRTAAGAMVIVQVFLSQFRIGPMIGSETALYRVIRSEKTSQCLQAGRAIEAELRHPDKQLLMNSHISFAARCGRAIHETLELGDDPEPPQIGLRLRHKVVHQLFDRIIIYGEDGMNVSPDLQGALSSAYVLDHVVDDSSWKLLPWRPVRVFKPKRWHGDGH